MKNFTFDDDDQEPTFSLHDFKKWLSQQRKSEKETDALQEAKVEKPTKEESKQEFKENFKKRLNGRKKKD